MGTRSGFADGHAESRAPESLDDMRLWAPNADGKDWKLTPTAGYLLAAHAPSVFGTAHALNAAGMIAMLLALAVPCSFGVRALVSRRSA